MFLWEGTFGCLFVNTNDCPKPKKCCVSRPLGWSRPSFGNYWCRWKVWNLRHDFFKLQTLSSSALTVRSTFPWLLTENYYNDNMAIRVPLCNHENLVVDTDKKFSLSVLKSYRLHAAQFCHSKNRFGDWWPKNARIIRYLLIAQGRYSCYGVYSLHT